MTKKVFLVLLLITFLVSSLSTFAAEVNEDVLTELEEKENVSVIVLLKEDARTISKNLEERKEAIADKQEEVLGELNLEDKKGFLGIMNEDKDFEVGHQYSTINGFSGEVTEEGLKKLMDDPNVEKIEFNRPVKIYLDQSIPQINADDVQNLSIAGFNITGAGETVCVIDTGIDYNHSALGVGWGNKVLGGFRSLSNGVDVQDCSLNHSACFDDNGHGTHVAGIVASTNDTYKGVAPGANLISVKVMDSGGSGYYSDVIAGIEWCSNISNVQVFNISVISMSLGCDGDCTHWQTACDDSYRSVADAINSAVAQNISVMVSAGNSGWTDGISDPACIANATPVGAVNSADSIFYNRGDLLSLLAPGKNIYSTMVLNPSGTILNSCGIGNTFCSISGTSMSTPHVAGTVALFRQYWRLAYNQTPTPQQIEDKFDLTGKLIDDSSGSGNNYSRIDILKAIQPYINFTADSPTNNTTIAVTSTLINITSDINLSTALLEWDHQNGTIENITMNQSSSINFYYTMIDLNESSYTYKAYGNDSVNTFGVSEERTINVDLAVPNITFYNHLNNSYINQEFNLNISLATTLLDFSNYSVANSSGAILQTNNNNSIAQATFTWPDLVNITNSTFPDDNYTLTVFANDSLGLSSVDQVDFIVDKTPPLLFEINQTPGTVYTNSTVIFTVNATDLYLNTSTIIFSSNFSGNWTNYSMILESGDKYNFTLSGTENLTNQKMIEYLFYASDFAGNINTSDSYNFTVQNLAPFGINITAPANNAIIEVGETTQFTGTATDTDNDTLTYTWDFADGTAFSSLQNPTHQYNYAGDFVVVLNVSDSYDNSLANITIIVNDTQAPTTNIITYFSELHLQRDGANQSVNITVFDYSGISAVTLEFNDTLQTASCSDENTSWNCSWEWGSNFVVGSYNFSINTTDDFGVQHTNSTTYSFTVTSCSDNTQNGDEAGTDCGGSCSACPSSSSSSSGSSGGGGSGGGGGGTGIASTAADEPVVEKVPDIEPPAAQEAAEEVIGNAAEENTAEALQPNEEEAALSGNESALTGAASAWNLKEILVDFSWWWIVAVAVAVIISIGGYFMMQYYKRDEEEEIL